MNVRPGDKIELTHPCNFYCSGNVHASVVWTDKDEAAILDEFPNYFDVVSIRSSPETKREFSTGTLFENNNCIPVHWRPGVKEVAYLVLFKVKDEYLP